MRVLFTSLAARGHYFPLVPLGWVLRASGHEVRVAVEPAFVPFVTESGLPAVAVGHDIDLAEVWRGVAVEADGATRPEEHHRRRAARSMLMCTTVAEAVAGDLIEYCRDFRPDLIVYEPRAYAGPLAAQLIGVPSVRHLWGPDYTYGRRDLERPFLEPLWARFGLGEATHLGDQTVDPCPAGAQATTPPGSLPMRYVPYNGAGAAPRWLLTSPRRPRACVTWGTTFARASGHLQPAVAAIRAAAALAREVVVVTTPQHRLLLGSLPSRVRVAESMPLHLVLPTCDLVIHQGGAGTTVTSLVSGTPQLVVPAMADTFFNADRVAACGAGLGVPAAECDQDTLGAAVAKLLWDPSFAAAAAAVAAENARRPAVGRVAGELENLVPGR